MVDVYRSILDLVRSGAPSAQSLAQIIVLSGDLDPVVELSGQERLHMRAKSVGITHRQA